VYGKHATHDIFVDFDAKSVIDLLGRTQPNFGLRRFISTMVAMSCVDGPFGPGFGFRWEEENSRRYFRWTSA
jgi:hypothetical protein